MYIYFLCYNSIFNYKVINCHIFHNRLEIMRTRKVRNFGHDITN